MRGRMSAAAAVVAFSALLLLAPPSLSAPTRERSSSACKPRLGTVELTWETESEADIIGFDVFRGSLRLNCRMIRAKYMGQLRGSSYRFFAQDGPGDFRLRITHIDGTRTWFE